MDYLIVKVIHLLFVISWFAGLFYLPRIFVNIAETTHPEVQKHLIVMARRLLRFMTILAIPAIFSGWWLWWGIGVGQGQNWLYAKWMVVLGIIGYHYCCARIYQNFVAGCNHRSGRFYRLFNEIPVIFMLAVLILVIVRPNF